MPELLGAEKDKLTMKTYLKHAFARLPEPLQQEIRRQYYRRQIRKGTFEPDEREYEVLGRYVSEEDWVLDIGANIGYYTLKLSELVGPRGRVFAVEPVPSTFELLASNVRCAPFRNITLLNLAASNELRLSGMEIPNFDTGIINHYEARLSDRETDLRVVCMPLDAFSLPHRISLVKIDVEDHDLPVLQGMTRLLMRDHPLLIIEYNSEELQEFLSNLGYCSEQLERSPNVIYQIGRAHV